jgi:hypothetical protein
MSEEKFDPETADINELIARANAGEGEQPASEANEVTTAAETEEQAEEVDEVVYRREIDLGDGSGKQVFEADSLENLVDKLAKAQENATRKIRELSTTKKVENKPSEEEEFVLAQELATSPSLAFDKMFQKRFGKTPEQLQQILQRVEGFDRQQAERTAAEEFVSGTPDYVANKANGTRITRYLETYKLEGTVENMQKAFKDLSESGLLETKTVETQDAETRNGTRIVTVAGHQRRAASGLSSKRTASTPTRATGPTLEELESMPLGKLLDLANKELAAQ